LWIPTFIWHHPNFYWETPGLQWKLWLHLEFGDNCTVLYVYNHPSNAVCSKELFLADLALARCYPLTTCFKNVLYPHHGPQSSSKLCFQTSDSVLNSRVPLSHCHTIATIGWLYDVWNEWMSPYHLPRIQARHHRRLAASIHAVAAHVRRRNFIPV
jgi:hypothetical protein